MPEELAAVLAEIAAGGNLSDGLEFRVQQALGCSDPEQCYNPDLVRAAAAARGSEARGISAKFKARFGKKFSPGRFKADVREARQELQRNSLDAAPAYRQRGRVERPNLLDYLFNDHGNAERLIALSGGDLKYCHVFKKWLVWDGRRWALDYVDQAWRLAKQSMLEFLQQAVDTQNEAAEKFAKLSLDARRISSLLLMSQCEAPIEPDQLDTDPYLLNFLNGTVDLRTGVLRPHQRADFITKLIHYEYRPGTPCARWVAFLDEVMGGGPDASCRALKRADELTAYLQRALGYSLTGVTSEKAVFVPFGSGNNGKSTMLSTVRQLAWEYSVLLQVDTLMVRQESSNSQADLADLRGARFVQTSEAEEGQRLAQGKLKRITQGMGTIKAVRKYENPFEFRETHKLWMDTNRKPAIRDAEDRATFQRLHPIPFTVVIPDAAIDRELPGKLMAEAPGILAWLVEGAQRWHSGGLQRPPEVEAAREEWREESDQIGKFLDDSCVLGPDYRVRSSTLYSRYKAWCEHVGEHELTLTTFGKRLDSRGVSKDRKTDGVWYAGIAVRT